MNRRYFSLTCPICGRTETFETPSPYIAHFLCGPHFLNGRETMISVGPDARNVIANKFVESDCERLLFIENPVFEVTTA